MLRITARQEKAKVVLQLEGDLTGIWVGDLLIAWRAARRSLDGRTLTYQTQLRQDARLTKAIGKATLGAEPGKLSADLGRYKQDSDLPARTLAPAAARAALLEALSANKPGAI